LLIFSNELIGKKKKRHSPDLSTPTHLLSPSIERKKRTKERKKERKKVRKKERKKERRKKERLMTLLM